MADRILKYAKLVMILVIVAFSSGLSGACDVYFITYATVDGRTGHSALAVDDYNIFVHDTMLNGTLSHRYDTVRKGSLTYFDFWPEKDFFSILNIGRNTRARYNRLPAATYDTEITLNKIMRSGIPHIKNYPCDGILMLNTSPAKDRDLVTFMDSIIMLNRPFNARKYNCSDFVLSGARHVTGRRIRAREFVPFSFSTTPNRLYRKLRRIPGIKVIVDPGKKVKGFFFRERVLEMLIGRGRSKPL